MRYQVPDFDSVIQRAYESFLTGGDRAIDVGAHVGRHTIPIAGKVVPHGQVFAFEPLPMCRETLAEQIAKLPSGVSNLITIYPYALGDFDGEAEFVLTIDDLAYSGLKQRVYDNPTRLERMSVLVRRLDSLFFDLPSLEYVKIDAEGGEFHVLRGAVQCLRKFRPLVTFEFGANSIGEYKITALDMAQLWCDAEYKVYDIKGKYLTNDDFVVSATVQDVWDYIAIPSENTRLETVILKAIQP